MVEITKEVTKKEKDLAAIWYNADEVLQKAKEVEKKARNNLIKACFSKSKNVEGVTTLNMGKGFQIKFKNTFTRTFDETKLTDAVMKKFTPKVRKLLFVIKHSLGTKVYKKLTAKEKKIVDRVLITKPGSSSVELVTPKE